MCSISRDLMLSILLTYIFRLFSTSCSSCCITGTSTDAPTMKNDNFRFSRWAGFCPSDVQTLLNHVKSRAYYQKKATALFFVVFSNVGKASQHGPSSLLASASSEQLASHKGVSCSKVDGHTEQVGDGGREPRQPLQALQSNTCFVRPAEG